MAHIYQIFLQEQGASKKRDASHLKVVLARAMKGVYKPDAEHLEQFRTWGRMYPDHLGKTWDAEVLQRAKDTPGFFISVGVMVLSALQTADQVEGSNISCLVAFTQEMIDEKVFEADELKPWDVAEAMKVGAEEVCLHTLFPPELVSAWDEGQSGDWGSNLHTWQGYPKSVCRMPLTRTNMAWRSGIISLRDKLVHIFEIEEHERANMETMRQILQVKGIDISGVRQVNAWLVNAVLLIAGDSPQPGPQALAACQQMAKGDETLYLMAMLWTLKMATYHGYLEPEVMAKVETYADASSKAKMEHYQAGKEAHS